MREEKWRGEKTWAFKVFSRRKKKTPKIKEKSKRVKKKEQLFREEAGLLGPPGPVPGSALRCAVRRDWEPSAGIALCPGGATLPARPDAKETGAFSSAQVWDRVGPAEAEPLTQALIAREPTVPR